MRCKVVKILNGYRLHGMAVENMVGPGTPDVAYIGGWIECKKTKKWPVRSTTPVRLDHGLLDTQRLWIRKHAKHGGRVFVLIQVALEFLLLDGMVAVSFLGTSTQAELKEHSLLVCRGWKELEARLKEYL